MLRKSSVSVALVVLAASLVSGCIFFPSAKDKALRKTPSFKEGYSDGCAAATTQSSNYREGPYKDQVLYQSDEAYRAKSEGRERNEAAASERVRTLAVAQIGVAAFESGRAGGCTLGDDQIAALAFSSTDMP